MMNESDWSGGKHLHHRKAITFARQGGEETNWEFRSKKLVQKTSISPKCDAVLHLDHSVNWTSIGSYDGESKNGSVAYTLSRLLFNEQRETSRDDARGIVASVKHERRGQQPRNDGTKDQRVRGTQEHRYSGVPQGWHLDSPNRRRTDEYSPHHELTQVDDVPRHQSRSDLHTKQSNELREHLRYAFRQAQRGDCVQGGRRESDRFVTCEYGRCRVECGGDQVSTGDERRPQVISVNRLRTGIDGGYALVLVLVKVQLKKEIGRPQRDDVSCCSILFGRVLWITRRQSQLESDPCEALRSNPRRQHRVAGSGQAKIEGGADRNQG